MHNKRQKALHKAFIALENKVNIQQNKVIHLEDSMVMYGIFNFEALEKLSSTVYKMHRTTTPNEKLFAQKHRSWNTWYLTEG